MNPANAHERMWAKGMSLMEANVDGTWALLGGELGRVVNGASADPARVDGEGLQQCFSRMDLPCSGLVGRRIGG